MLRKDDGVCDEAEIQDAIKEREPSVAKSVYVVRGKAVSQGLQRYLTRG